MTNEELGKIVRDLFYQATAPELGVLGGRVGDLEAQVKRVESWAGEKFTELNKRLVELEGWSKRTEGARVVYLDGVKGSKEDVLGRLENHLSVLSKHQDRLLSLEAQVKALSAKKVPAGAYPAELEHPCFEDPDDVVDCLAFGVESCDHKNRKDGTWDNCTSGKFSEHYTQGQPPSSLASAVAQEGLAEWEARIRAEERAKCEAEVCDHHNEFEAKIRAEERERVAKWMEATDHYMGAAVVRSMPPAPAPEARDEIVNTVDSTEVPAPDVKGESSVHDGSWRWAGTRWEHACPDRPLPQAGHFPAYLDLDEVVGNLQHWHCIRCGAVLRVGNDVTEEANRRKVTP
jgi:hypothetical protein